MDAPERDQLLARAGDHQHALRMDRHVRVGGREGAGVTEVHRRVHAVEEPRLGQQKNSRAGRAKKRAAAMHGAKPVDQLRCRPFCQPCGPSKIEGTMTMSVASSVGDAALHRDGYAAGELERAGLAAPRSRPETAARAVRCRSGHHGERIHHVEDAAQRRHHGLRDGDEAHMERLRACRGQCTTAFRGFSTHARNSADRAVTPRFPAAMSLGDRSLCTAEAAWHERPDSGQSALFR